ncbi:MAG: CapA family protein [bacterium]|nr:MAG: CapA family protein [bacterium]
MQRFFAGAALVLIALLPGPLHGAEPGGGFTIALLGDFLPAGSADPYIARSGYGYLFSAVRPILAATDGAVLNLETPLTEGGSAAQGKAYTFRASPAAAAAMAREGVKAVWLANNHILDFGAVALRDTVHYLDEAGLSHVGAGMNVAEAAAPANVPFGTGRASLLAFSNTFPDSYWARKDRPGTFFGAPGPVGRAVERTLGAFGSPVVVSFHWGEELMAEPKDYQVDLAHLAVEKGAALVVGHHPHVPQPLEIYRGVPILYSLGNFSFGSYSTRSGVGILAVARFDSRGRCDLLHIHPLLVDNTQVRFQPRPITGLEGQSIFDPLVRGIGPGQAEVSWDGEKGIIKPLPADSKPE